MSYEEESGQEVSVDHGYNYLSRCLPKRDLSLQLIKVQNLHAKYHVDGFSCKYQENACIVPCNLTIQVGRGDKQDSQEKAKV